MEENVVEPAVPDPGDIVGTAILTGTGAMVVNDEPIVVAVSVVEDLIVSVGVYVVPEVKPEIDTLVPVVPVYTVSSPEIVKV